jgi:hypothetical protein
MRYFPSSAVFRVSSLTLGVTNTNTTLITVAESKIKCPSLSTEMDKNTVGHVQFFFGRKSANYWDYSASGNPQIHGLLPISQIRKFPRFACPPTSIKRLSDSATLIIKRLPINPSHSLRVSIIFI